MDKIWLKSYPPNVPADVDTSAYASLAALFEDSFKKYAWNMSFPEGGVHFRAACPGRDCDNPPQKIRVRRPILWAPPPKIAG